jgi:hypothetical protein
LKQESSISSTTPTSSYFPSSTTPSNLFNENNFDEIVSTTTLTDANDPFSAFVDPFKENDPFKANNKIFDNEFSNAFDPFKTDPFEAVCYYIY